jgi:predicted unusual protein kinase regulating ubiquinone biosynthesis (AarF/ABC1/UbiB family)
MPSPVAEVDYVAEARNTMEFSAAMERRGLNAVTAPTVVTELSSSKVLVTEWVEGTRLDRDASDDVPRLCGVAINAYLTMLLDTGTLHCDPHPGNLLRTTDGRLCVLDWGMTLSVPGDLQYGLLEFIAHVNSGDFDAIPADFVNLGFTPPDKLERVKNSGIVRSQFSLPPPPLYRRKCMVTLKLTHRPPHFSAHAHRRRA